MAADDSIEIPIWAFALLLTLLGASFVLLIVVFFCMARKRKILFSCCKAEKGGVQPVHKGKDVYETHASQPQKSSDSKFVATLPAT